MVQNNKSNKEKIIEIIENNNRKAVKINGFSLTQIKIIVELWWDEKQLIWSVKYAIDIHK